MLLYSANHLVFIFLEHYFFFLKILLKWTHFRYKPYISVYEPPFHSVGFSCSCSEWNKLPDLSQVQQWAGTGLSIKQKPAELSVLALNYAVLIMLLLLLQLSPEQNLIYFTCRIHNLAVSTKSISFSKSSISGALEFLLISVLKKQLFTFFL